MIFPSKYFFYSKINRHYVRFCEFHRRDLEGQLNPFSAGFKTGALSEVLILKVSFETFLNLT